MRDQVAALLRIALLGVLGGALVLIGQQPAPTQPEPVTDADRAAHLVATHDCKVQGYGGEVIPGHAVVDTGSGPRYTHADVAFEIAFEGRPGTVYAFCI